MVYGQQNIKLFLKVHDVNNFTDTTAETTCYVSSHNYYYSYYRTTTTYLRTYLQFNEQPTHTGLAPGGGMSQNYPKRSFLYLNPYHSYEPNSVMQIFQPTVNYIQRSPS
jgi:hypothetical protein